MLHLRKEEGRRRGERREQENEENNWLWPPKGIRRLSDGSFLALASAVAFFSVMNNFVVLLKAS